MAIVRMKKVRLLVLRSRRDELMKELARFGNMEITEPQSLLAEPEMAERFARENSELVRLRTDQTALLRALDILGQYAPEKSSLFAQRPQVDESAVMDEAALETDILLAERIVALDERARRCEAQIAQNRALSDSLKPWEPLDYPLDGKGTKTVSALFGTLRAESDPNNLQAAAVAVSDAVQLFRVSSDADQHRFFVLCMKNERAPMLAALHDAGFESVSFPELHGTARENISVLRRERAKLEAQKKEYEKQIEAAASSRGELKLGSDRMAAAIARCEAIELLSGTESVVAVEGWCPAEKQPELEALLTRYDCAWELLDPAEDEYPTVPVKLKNNVFARAMNMVTEMYSLPAYGTTDPNPLMAPFFILFYGMMMADMGYGLLMIAGAAFVLLKMRPRESLRNFGDLLLYCGISTLIFGALTGGFFGDFLPRIAAIINPDTTFTALPALFTPLDDTMAILVGALCLGVIQTVTGMAVSVVNKFRAGNWAQAVFDEITWWIILAGIALMVLGVGNVSGLPVVLLVGCAMLVVGQFILKKSVMGGLLGVLVAIYNGATGFFSDILSYSRLMALMLSGSIIATVFNTLAAIPGSTVVTKLIFFVVISALGNALNFALNILGCYVHDLRLQCLEFFGRFYTDGGRAFAPLHLNTKYVDIIKEEN